MDRVEKRWSTFFHNFFYAELAILHQKWKGYICVNIGQNVVQKTVHIY